MMERDEVRAVFFDAGYTLLCMDPPQETLFLRVCDELAISVDRSRLADAVKTASAMLAPRVPARSPEPYSQARVDAFWIEYHRMVLVGCTGQVIVDQSHRAEEVYRRFTAALKWRIYDDVLPLLTALRERGVTLGVISNWTGDLEDVLRAVGLHASFDFVLDSARLGHEKPHPEIFAEALRRSGSTARGALHVGDSIEHDVDGALRSGLRPVLIDRSGKYHGFDRATRVEQLDDVLALV